MIADVVRHGSGSQESSGLPLRVVVGPFPGRGRLVGMEYQVSTDAFGATLGVGATVVGGRGGEAEAYTSGVALFESSVPVLVAGMPGLPGRFSANGNPIFSWPLAYTVHEGPVWVVFGIERIGASARRWFSVSVSWMSFRRLGLDPVTGVWPGSVRRRDLGGATESPGLGV